MKNKDGELAMVKISAAPCRKERPIIFSTAMVQAILDGRKSQTRRVVKPQPHETRAIGKPVTQVRDYFTGAPEHGLAYYWMERGCYNSSEPFKCPYGQPGDRLWVRETWAIIDNHGLEIRQDVPISYVEYKADTNNPYPGEWPSDEAKGNPEAPKWKPSIFMPKKYARIWLEITDIRVERLQNIRSEDIEKEGIDPWRDYEGGQKYSFVTMRNSFQRLWDSINGKKYPWSSNPWVWIIEFKWEKTA